MKDKNFEIEILDIHWLNETPEEIDLCAHGQVRVRIGDEIIVNRRKSEDHWTLSAMAVHLLRTTKRDHNEENLVGEHLIPCCGHHIDHLENDLNVHIQGCFIGINYWVKHKEYTVELTSESGSKVEVENSQYINQVIKFADQVENFYKESKPKKMPKDPYDKIGYEMMWTEWKRRRNSLMFNNN